ncbi:MAG: AgmX/PglI C-terminal domain-containing protein, partial [Bdellovibrionota bacterium]
MGMPEVFLEHRKGEKVQKILRVKPETTVFVIGSSRSANLRINGEGVMGCHAVLRFRAPDWYVCDVSGTETLKVNGQTVTEAKIDAKTKVEIAGHRIQLFAHERKTDLFKDSEVTGPLTLQQVVVRSKSGRVIETHILNAAEPYLVYDGETRTSLTAPTSGDWVKNQIGPRLVQQRLVNPQELALQENLRVDENLRKPILIALAIFFFMTTTIFLLGKQVDKTPELALDNKSKEIIFDAKAIKKKVAEAKKVMQVAKARAGGTGMDSPKNNTMKSNQPEESQAPKVSEKATKALTSLRNAGLNNLIGKIAKRANKQGVMVAAVGVSPDTLNSGRALFSNGTSTVGGGGSASKAGDSYKLGGIGTQGKAGGVGNAKDGTALAGGNVGGGNVLALSDDEETLIEGGLDRDAIAEVIKRNLGQIRYCYERQLSSNPDLYGKVLVKFVIGADGILGAQKIDNSTLKSDMVEGCILRRMAGWNPPSQGPNRAARHSDRRGHRYQRDVRAGDVG